ncbi:MAG: hypothetical protein WCD75_02390 [Rhodoplanes sp.]
MRIFPIDAFSEERDFLILDLQTAKVLEVLGKSIVLITLGAEAHFGRRGDSPCPIENLMELAGQPSRLAFDISGNGFKVPFRTLVIAVREGVHQAFNETLRSASSQRISALCRSGLLARILARWRTDLRATRWGDLRSGSSRQDEECTKSAHERGEGQS